MGYNYKYLPSTDQNVVSIPEQCFKVIRVRIVASKYFTMLGH